MLRLLSPRGSKSQAINNDRPIIAIAARGFIDLSVAEINQPLSRVVIKKNAVDDPDEDPDLDADKVGDQRVDDPAADRCNERRGEAGHDPTLSEVFDSQLDVLVALVLVLFDGIRDLDAIFL